MAVTTIVADIDGSGPRALYANQEREAVLEALEGGKLVRCDSDIGELHVSSGAVKYVQAGRRELPPSAGPSSNATAQRQKFAGGG